MFTKTFLFNIYINFKIFFKYLYMLSLYKILIYIHRILNIQKIDFVKNNELKFISLNKFILV